MKKMNCKLRFLCSLLLEVFLGVLGVLARVNLRIRTLRPSHLRMTDGFRLSNFVIYASLAVRGGLPCVTSSIINHPFRAAASLFGYHWKTPARITSTSRVIQVLAVQES